MFEWKITLKWLCYTSVYSKLIRLQRTQLNWDVINDEKFRVNVRPSQRIGNFQLKSWQGTRDDSLLRYVVARYVVCVGVWTSYHWLTDTYTPLYIYTYIYIYYTRATCCIVCDAYSGRPIRNTDVITHSYKWNATCCMYFKLKHVCGHVRVSSPDSITRQLR